MKLKKSLLVKAVGLAALSSSAMLGSQAAFGTAYMADSYDLPNSNRARTAVAQSNRPGEGQCGPSCSDQGGAESEVSFVMTMDLSAAVPGTGAETGLLILEGAQSVTGGGDGSDDGEVTVHDNWTHLPNLGGFNIFFVDSGDFDLRKWRIAFTNDGKPVDGWYLYGASTGGANPFEVCSYFNTLDGEMDLAIALEPNSGGAANPAADIDCASLETEPDPLLATVPNHSVDTITDATIATCDVRLECGQFGKSVPVPAFAAGILALGLLGTTVAVRNRKSIK